MRRLLLLVILLAVLCLNACGSDDATGDDAGQRDGNPDTSAGGESPQDRLEDARRRWTGAGIADYDWSYEVSCFCPGVGFDIAVRGGAATEVTVRPSTSGALPPDDDPDEEPRFRTVEDLFDRIEATLDADEQDVEYDEETGRPIRLTVDPDEDTFDDEVSYSVTAFAERGLG